MESETKAPSVTPPSRRWLRRLVIAGILLGTITLAGGCFVWFLPDLLAGDSDADLPVEGAASAPSSTRAEPVRLATWNLAHGRSTGDHQVWRSPEELTANLRAIAAVCAREGIEILAAQEVDRPSWWSGDVDQVAILAGELARSGRSMAFVHGSHIDGFGLHYGTAVFSATPITRGASLRFGVHRPSWPKGATLAELAWPADPSEAVDVVSVHLDHRSDAARAAQLTELVDWLQGRDRPLIVIGDFNCDDGDGSPLGDFVETLDLYAHAWGGPDQSGTFIASDQRIDWILVSRHFRIVDHRVLEEELSDHRAVVADLELVAP